MSFLDLEKLIEYSTSAVIVVSSYPCVGPSPRTNTPFLLLSICINGLFSTPKIITIITITPI